MALLTQKKGTSNGMENDPTSFKCPFTGMSVTAHSNAPFDDNRTATEGTDYDDFEEDDDAEDGTDTPRDRFRIGAEPVDAALLATCN